MSHVDFFEASNGDRQCRMYVRQHCDDELADIYNAEKAGHFRGDICRAVVLLQVLRGKRDSSQGPNRSADSFKHVKRYSMVVGFKLMFVLLPD